MAEALIPVTVGIRCGGNLIESLKPSAVGQFQVVAMKADFNDFKSNQSAPTNTLKPHRKKREHGCRQTDANWVNCFTSGSQLARVGLRRKRIRTAALPPPLPSFLVLWHGTFFNLAGPCCLFNRNMKQILAKFNWLQLGLMNMNRCTLKRWSKINLPINCLNRLIIKQTRGE